MIQPTGQRAMYDEQLFLAGPPLVVGHTRQVHAHPERPDRLVKVLRPELIDAQHRPLGRRYKLWRRTGRFQCFLREIREYLAFHARFPGEACPLAPISGLATTNLGLGLVVPKITDGKGGLAPTVAQLVERDGLTPALRQLLEALLARLLACDVIVHDLNAGNLLLYVGGEGVDEAEEARLVLADGFGERHIVPICSMSRACNRYQTRKRFGRLLKRLESMAPR